MENTVSNNEISIRSSDVRLSVTLRRSEEALSPRALRRLLGELQTVVDPQVSEIEGGRRARDVAHWYANATQEVRRDVWMLLVEQFAPDAQAIQNAREQFDAKLGTPEQGQAEMRLRRALVSPRARLLQRFAAFPEGMRFLVNLRAELLPKLKTDKRLLVLDAELEHLFSTWFDVGSLELRRISWDSPASLVEKLIQYEAVHDIKSWADVKNRLDADRRCYGFFSPRLPDEPLIFVEVALQSHVADCITPLLDEHGEQDDLARASTAIFYSISNTQAGLKGVSFGDSLIKRVVEALQQEFPRLRTFATLSPMPGFRAWVAKHADHLLEAVPGKARAELAHELNLPNAKALTAQLLVASLESVLAFGPESPRRRWLLAAGALYLGRELVNEKPADPVARFHLGNGAMVERINWGADPSPKGVRQSYGLMVNYLYDLKRLDKHRDGLAQGKIAVARAVTNLAY